MTSQYNLSGERGTGLADDPDDEPEEDDKVPSPVFESALCSSMFSSPLPVRSMTTDFTMIQVLQMSLERSAIPSSESEGSSA